MYLFGAAIKVYNIKEKTTAARCIRCYLSMIIVTFLSKAVIFTATNLVFGQAKFDRILITYTSVTIVFASVFLFLFCLKINTGNQIQKVVRFVAPATLGVYLIHAHPYVFRFLLNDAFAAYAHKPALVMVLYVLATAMGIFLLCVTIEKVRIQLFKLVKISRLCDIIGKKATELYAIFVKE